MSVPLVRQHYSLCCATHTLLAAECWQPSPAANCCQVVAGCRCQLLHAASQCCWCSTTLVELLPTCCCCSMLPTGAHCYLLLLSADHVACNTRWMLHMLLITTTHTISQLSAIVLCARCNTVTVNCFCFCFLQADVPEGSAATVIGMCGDVSNADDMNAVRDRVEVMC
jgi:hypothetical protein